MKIKKSITRTGEVGLESALRMAKQKLERDRFGGKLSLKRYGTETAHSEQEKLKAGGPRAVRMRHNRTASREAGAAMITYEPARDELINK